MNGVSGYILTVTAASILAAILRTLAGEGSMGKLVQLLAGVFVALTVISPLMHLELPDPARWLEDYAADGTAAAAAGENMARNASRAIITEQAEAYIVDKAALYRANLDAAVELDEDGAPVSVTLTGNVAPYARARLSQIIETDLGIGEEAQRWLS